MKPSLAIEQSAPWAGRLLQALREKQAELELGHARLVRDDQGVTSEAPAGAPGDETLPAQSAPP